MIGPAAPIAPWPAAPVVNVVIGPPMGPVSRASSVIVTGVSSLVVAVMANAWVAPSTLSGKAAPMISMISSEVRTRRRTFTLSLQGQTLTVNGVSSHPGQSP